MRRILVPIVGLLAGCAGTSEDPLGSFEQLAPPDGYVVVREAYGEGAARARVGSAQVEGRAEGCRLLQRGFKESRIRLEFKNGGCTVEVNQ